MKANLLSKSGIRSLLIGLTAVISLLMGPMAANATEEVYYNGLKRQQLLTALASFEVWGYTSGSVEQTLSVKNLMWFSIDEDTILKDMVFTHWVKVKIERYGIDTTLLGTDTIQFTVNHNHLEGTTYKFGDVYEFRNAYRFKATVIAKSSSFPAHMKLEGKIIINRKYTFDCAAPPELLLKSHNDLIDTSTRSLQIGWQKMDGAEEYDFEWAFYDTLSPTITLASGSSANFNFVFKNNATRITTSQTSYNIPMMYPKGRIYWRIRGVRTKNGARQTGKWSTQKSSIDTLDIRKEWYWVNPHEQELNWQMQSVFAEEGKKSQSVTYFDGSMRNRQKVVRSDATELIIASETIYDSLGRAALQVMPAPVSYDSSENAWIKGIRFNPSFSAAQGTTDYSSADFDFNSTDCNVASTNPAAKMDSLHSAVGRYYSSFNPARKKFMNKFTPTAEGYPFALAEYMPDGTGRIRRQGGVGDKFQLGSGHETRYFYSRPDEWELDRLFGNEAGHASHYQKNAVMDPNGQLSVSYIDAHGRTIATALAGVVPMDGDSIRLRQLSNFVAANRIKKNLLDSLREGMALTSTYSLTVTNDGARDSIIYTFYPRLELSIDSCLSEARCYDCKYDLEIKVMSECGDTIVNFAKSNFMAGSFDTICEVLPDTIYRLFDLNPGFKVGQYQVTKSLKINESALNYYADDYLKHLTCLPDTQTLKSRFLGDTSCNKTCEECYTILGSLEDFRGRYLDGITSLSPQDTANADTIYYRAILSCAQLCDEGDPSDCGIMYETMLVDVYPGGQYAEYDTMTLADPDGDFIFKESTDETSVFYLGMGEVEYPYQKVVDVGGANSNLYRDEFGNVDYILREDSIKTRIDSLTINEFITYFKPSWAKTLVKTHPEYCSYLCCKANSNFSWDSLFSTVTTYAGAVAAGYLPIDSLINQDPFFQANDSLETLILEVWNNFTTTAPSACSSPISLTEILISLIYCGGVLPCSDTPGGSCTADNDMYWQLVQSYYLSEKSRLKWLKIRGGVCAGLDTLSPYCKGYNELCFGKTVCGIVNPNPYENKIPRVFIPTPPLSGEAVEDTIYSLLDTVNIKLANACDSTCNGMASQWIQLLSLTCTVIAEADVSELEELHDRFVAICKSGCDFDHPFGSVTTNGTPTSFNDRNLQNAIDSVFFSGTSHACDTACSAKLIDYPGTFNIKQYLAPPTQIATDDPCICDRLNDLEDCWTLVLDTSLLQYINKTSDVKITQAQLDKLLDGCATDCHFMNEAILVPPILECNTCKTLTTVKDSMTAFLAGCGDTSTVGQMNLVAAHLNQVLGLNRTYDEYRAFAITGLQTYPLCRYLCPLSRFTPVNVDTSCVNLELQEGALAFASLQYQNLLDSMRQVFVRNYLGKCLGPDLVERFEARVSQSEYHYTLYYYDQADNLVRTVPPNGVVPLSSASDLTAVKNHREDPMNAPKYPEHNFITRYWYNSLNQIVRDSTPDRGDSDYWYDKLGRLVLSQNAKQRALNDYTYSVYDLLGRVVETGRVRKTDPDGLATIGTVWDYETFSDWLTEDLVGTYEVTQSYYDEPILALSTLLSPYFSDPYGTSGQANLRNRIATVSFEKIKDGDTLTYDYATHYSYDVSGNVKQMVQDIPELDIDTDANHRFKRIAYDYDLVSGKVNYVFYQKDSVDQFIHHYVYDADNRVQFVETSRDSLLWERDANYEYYLHGPLGRTEIGERRVQGIDYAYTLQGWLKGMNASALSLASPNTADINTRDMGRDGKSSNTGDFARNKNVSRDVAAFTLSYYYGDYRKVNTTAGDNFELKYASNADFHMASSSLYNGNIRHTVYTIARLNEAFGYAQPEGFSYKYDQLNRLVSQRERINYTLGSTYAWSNVSAERSHFREDVTYDPNGNIQTYLRHGNNSGNFVMDNLSYTYQSGTNKLTHIDDAQTNQSAYTGDLEDQSSGNYDYDEIGNLIQDTRDSITSITWTNAQKIDSIAKTDRSIWFGYDAMQNRVVKHSKPTGSDLEKRTYYVRDAQGNVMATYSAWVQNDDGAITWDSLKLSEQHIYGSSRVGLALPGVKLFPEIPANPHACDSCLYPIFEGRKHYEISNHLGNVLAVITDRKRAGNTTGPDIEWFDADVVSAQQYYPFGMLMPDTTSTNLRRQYSNPNCFDKDYRYGFNGKEGDDEVKGDDNQQDYGMRIYDPRVGRFLSVDPIAREYPWYTPYQFAGNMPIWAVDLDGLEPAFKGSTGGQYEIAKKQGSDQYFGWSWHGTDKMWNQGDITEYSSGDASWNSPDDDLTKSFHPGQDVNALCISSESCHYNTFLLGFGAGTSLENDMAMIEAGILFQRFDSGNGEPYSFGLHTEMSRILGEDAGFVGFARDFEFDAMDYYKVHGNLDGFEGLENYVRPYIKDTWYMHTVMGGNQQIDAQIQSISADHIVVSYRVWDHFGAGRNDATSSLPGLPSLYWLQHVSGLQNPELRDRYQPFIWNIEVKR